MHKDGYRSVVVFGNRNVWISFKPLSSGLKWKSYRGRTMPLHIKGAFFGGLNLWFCRTLIHTLNLFIPDKSNTDRYTIHYKILQTSINPYEVGFSGCSGEVSKYRQPGYEDIPITMPNPTNIDDNNKIYRILQKTLLNGIWLDSKDFFNNRRRSMRKNQGSLWSDKNEKDNGLMCVFVDYTDITNSVCTTVSLISQWNKNVWRTF